MRIVFFVFVDATSSSPRHVLNRLGLVSLPPGWILTLCFLFLSFFLFGRIPVRPPPRSSIPFFRLVGVVEGSSASADPLIGRPAHHKGNGVGGRRRENEGDGQEQTRFADWQKNRRKKGNLSERETRSLRLLFTAYYLRYVARISNEEDSSSLTLVCYHRPSSLCLCGYSGVLVQPD